MKRPSLPIGHPLSASMSVERALHVTDQIEIYSVLGVGSSQARILALAGDSLNEAGDWWSSLHNASLTFEQFDESAISAKYPLAAIFASSGLPVQEGQYKQASSGEIERVLHSIVDSAIEALPLGIVPSFEIGVSWIPKDGIATSLLTVKLSSDEETVRYVAASFYRLLTGIDVFRRKRPDLLSQWFKAAGTDLSRVVADCFLDERGKQRTRTLAKLESDLGRVPATTSEQESSQDDQAFRGKEDRPFGLAKVAGMHALKELLLNQVVGPVRNPEPFRKYGLSVPNGILLYGPPGCGKTYIARALAEELGHHFLEIVPSELASPYVHGSVIRIREVFDEAAQNAPAVIFIDEFEALVPVRSDLGGFQQHKAEEVNEVLTHLNSASERNIFVVAATNQPELIDPAIRRTGRLDKLIYVSPPDREARHEMLQLHLAKRPVSSSIDLEALSARLLGYSASDIRFLVDEAARNALIRNVEIDGSSFELAIARITPSIPPEMERQYQSIEQRGLA